MVQITPMPGWALCRVLPHASHTASGLLIPGDVDKEVMSEGVAEVVSVTPDHDGVQHLANGEKVVYRGFLRFANPVGNLLGEKRDCALFLIKTVDILAIVRGDGTVGLNGEYRI